MSDYSSFLVHTNYWALPIEYQNCTELRAISSACVQIAYFQKQGRNTIAYTFRLYRYIRIIIESLQILLVFHLQYQHHEYCIGTNVAVILLQQLHYRLMHSVHKPRALPNGKNLTLSGRLSVSSFITLSQIQEHQRLTTSWITELCYYQCHSSYSSINIISSLFILLQLRGLSSRLTKPKDCTLIRSFSCKQPD